MNRVHRNYAPIIGALALVAWAWMEWVVNK